jgi:hypothetical protein
VIQQTLIVRTLGVGRGRKWRTRNR